MSKRFENGYFALVITCLFGMASIGVVSVGFFQLKGYQSADQEHAAYYAERHQAEVNYRECLEAAVTLNGARECINNAPSRTRDAQRAEQDLNAQREMAQWAEGMLWAAWTVGLLTFFATVIGVRYIYLTLVSTQDMAAQAESIGNKQVAASIAAVNAARDANKVAAEQFKMGFKPKLKLNISGPYIDETKCPLNQFADGEAPRWTRIELLVEVENTGDQPATITGFFIGTLDPPFEIGGWGRLEMWIDLPKGGKQILHSSSHMLPEPHIGGELAHAGGFMLTPEIREEIFARPPKVIGHIDYLDALGVKRQMGFCVVPLSAWGGGLRRWGGDQYNYDREID